MCIKDDCNPKTIQSKDKKAKCEVCGSKLKKLGISTSILHKGTQEALNKMKR
jgi:predicted nucleic acid-binding Zn ribbon protein